MLNASMLLWAGLLPRWPRRLGVQVPGYTLLLPVPGDLPMFTRLALDVCRRQSREHRVSALVISDLPSSSIEEMVVEERAAWPDLEYVAATGALRKWLERRNDPGRFHAVQLILGVARSRSSHVILHDADAILLDRSFLDAQYGFAVESGASVVGVHPLWDEALRRYRPDLVATWEMCASVDWLRRVPPYRHLAHEIPVGGRPHVADTTVYAQMRSKVGELVMHGNDAQFVHFNYVVSTYRKFQAAGGTAFEDAHFRILLIRALTDALGSTAPSALPTLATLASGLGSEQGPVTYPVADSSTRRRYRDFQHRLTEGLREIYGSDEGVLERLAQALAPFNRWYMRVDDE